METVVLVWLRHWLFLLVLFSPVVGQAQETREVLVLNVEGEILEGLLGAKKGAALSRLIAAEVHEASQALLGEHGFTVHSVQGLLELAEREGVELTCDQEPCGVSYASDLGVPYVVALRALNAQNQLMLTLKLLETSSGGFLDLRRMRVDGVEDFSRDLPGVLESLYTESGVLQLRASQPNSSASGATQPAPQMRAGSSSLPRLVKFVSTPRGASVYRAGAVLCEQTPCTRELFPGTHEITASYPGYPSYFTTITVFPGKESRPQVERLVLNTGPTGKVRVSAVWKDWWLATDAKSTEAPLEVNGIFVGHTPITLDLPVGQHVVRIASPLNPEKTIRVRRGRNKPIVLVRTPTLPRRIGRFAGSVAAVTGMLVLLALGGG